MHLSLGLRLRVMLTLGALAILPLVGVSWVVVHQEIAGVDQSLAVQRHDAAVAAQASLDARLVRRELAVVTAAASARLQRHDLAAFAARQHVVVYVGGHRYGHRLAHSATARVQLVSGGRRIGTVLVQVPRGRVVSLPAGEAADRTAAVYRRVEEGGLLALAALMLLTFALAHPLLRALRWTEQRATESRVDALTQIANRRALEETLVAEIARARRFRHELAVVILDLDHFKETNDTHGHATGDRVLREVSRLLVASARQGDTVARWGGEEFVAVLPETDLAGAVQLAERLRLAIGTIALGGARTSASCGVAALQPGDSSESLLAAADVALYRAKDAGRNRTEAATSRGTDDFPLPRAS